GRADEDAEEPARPGSHLGSVPGHAPGRHEPKRPLDRLEVLADDRDVLHGNTRRLQLADGILGREVIRVHGDDRPMALRVVAHDVCSVSSVWNTAAWKNFIH